MDKVEQRIDQIADDLSGAMDASVREAVAELRQIAAALREQPGARGVVDDVMVERAMNADAEEYGASIPASRVRRLLTAAQQPVQEGGGARLTNPWTGEPRDYRDVNSDPAGTLCVEPGAPLKAAPPERARGGVEGEGEFWTWLRQAYNFTGAGDFTAYNMEVAYQAGRDSALTQQPAQAAPGDDTKRLDWIESQVREYGDGYTEPLEASVVVQWQQQKPNERWPGLRAWVDEEMARTDDWLDATPPGDDAAGGA